ncbi:hypothetical protein ACA910_001554 [Epithemia clementina (nom. ined.)]
MWEPATPLWVQAILQFTNFAHVVWHGIYYQGQTRCQQSPKLSIVAAAASKTASVLANTLSLLVGLLSALHALVQLSTVIWYNVNLYCTSCPF